MICICIYDVCYVYIYTLLCMYTYVWCYDIILYHMILYHITLYSFIVYFMRWYFFIFVLIDIALYYLIWNDFIWINTICIYIYTMNCVLLNTFHYIWTYIYICILLQSICFCIISYYFILYRIILYYRSICQRCAKWLFLLMS